MGTPFTSHVPEDFWNILSRVGQLRTCQPRTVLYRSGAPATGIYLLQIGEVSFRFDSKKRRKKGFLKNAAAGSILGLGEAISGELYQLTAETVSTAQISFVPRPQLMEFLCTTPYACMQVVQLLSHDLHRLYNIVRQRPARGSSD